MTRLEVLVVLALLLWGLTLLLGYRAPPCGAGGVHYDIAIETRVIIDDTGDVECARVLFDLHCGCGRRRYREIGPRIEAPPRPALGRGALPFLLLGLAPPPRHR